MLTDGSFSPGLLSPQERYPARPNGCSDGRPRCDNSSRMRVATRIRHSQAKRGLLLVAVALVRCAFEHRSNRLGWRRRAFAVEAQW
jgi:hypothetical protein